MSVLLEMKGIKKSFGSTVALEHVDIDVHHGEVHALVGENGAGKSTLMKVLSGAILPDAGYMQLDGKIYAPKNPLHARALGVGMIYQELSIAPHLTVAENIVLGMEPSVGLLVNRKKMFEKAEHALAHFDHSSLNPHRLAGELSVSEQQLVEIARSLAMGCKLLVFDEPTSSLGQKDIEKLFQIIQKLSHQGIAIIYISHFMEEIKRLSSRLTVLRDGKAVATKETNAASSEQIVSLMVGRDVEDLYPRSDRKVGEVILECEALAGEKKPQHASLTVRRGEVIGIAGVVGAGRTELIRTLFALDPVKNGTVKIAGKEKTKSTPKERWSSGVGMLSENRKEEGLALNLSIAENITLTSLTRFTKFGLISPNKQNAAAEEWVEKLGIKCRDAAQSIGSLSGGNQQKAALARLLEHDCDVLLLDEPTRGIDIAAKARIYQVINQIVTDPTRPRAVVVISSYLPELFGICDKIAVLSRGVLSQARPVSIITPEDVMRVMTGEKDQLQ